MDNPQPSLQRIAIHEAGHAAMALIVGAKLHRVTLRRKGQMAGHTVSSAGSPSAEVLISLGGGVAESIRYHEQMTIGEGDAEVALRYVDREGLRRFAPIVSSLLRVHWMGVMELAKTLEKRESLTGKEAFDVFGLGLTRNARRRKR